MKHSRVRMGQFSQRVESVMLLVAAVMLSGLFVGCFGTQIEYPVSFNPPNEFLLGPEDVLVVTVWRNQELSKEVIVRPDGKISMPLIGDVPAAGVTANVLAKRIADGLAEFMSNPTVSVQVKEVNSYYIYVLGEVSRTGKIPLKSYATVLQGISLAGGFTPFAQRNKMHVLRIVANGHGEPREVQIPVPYDDMILGKQSGGNFFLKSGDIIVVP
jgi:polysaccharide export outer membrane protein